MYSVFRNSKTFLIALYEYRLNGGLKNLYEQTTALCWIKEASVTLVA